MVTSSSSNKSPGTTFWVTTATLLVAGIVAAGAVTIHRQRLQTTKSKTNNKKSSSSPFKFENGSREQQIQHRFEACVRIMKPQLSKLTQQEQLEYYGLYKQATLGNCLEFLTREPPPYDLVATAKYNAWKQYDGMDILLAMQEYIDKVIQLEYVKSISGDDGNDDNYELEGDAIMDVVGMGNKPSTLMALVDDDDDSAAAATEDAKYPLHAAAREGHLSDLKSILYTSNSVNSNNSNISPNAKDSSGQTPLHLASDRGHIDCVKHLVLNGADIDSVDPDGISILLAATIGGSVECCRLLLALGADPNQADNDGDTPYTSAQDDEELRDLFEQHRSSPLVIDDKDFIQQLKQRGITLKSLSTASSQSSFDVQKAMQNLDRPVSFDLDDDGDI